MPPSRFGDTSGHRRGRQAARVDGTDDNDQPSDSSDSARHRPTAAASTAYERAGTAPRRPPVQRQEECEDGTGQQHGRPAKVAQATGERAHLVDELVAHHRGTGELAELAAIITTATPVI